jgi:hypothetical protein
VLWNNREEGLRRLFILIPLYALPLMLMLRPPLEADTWWHLRTAEWIMDNGTVPITDHFCAYTLGKTWVAYSWLFALIVYGCYQSLGLLGIVLFRVAVGLAILLSIHRLVLKSERRFAWATILVVAAFFAMTPMFQERSWLFSILFYILTLDVILDLREGRPARRAMLLPLVYVLWANIHVQFANGIFLLGLACVSPVLDRVLGQDTSRMHADKVGTRAWWIMVAMSVACVLATLVNPYGVNLYRPVVELPTQAAPLQVIPEMHALTFRRLTDWAALALAGLATFALGRMRRLSAFDILLLIASAYLSFRALRDVWLLILAAVAILARSGLFQTGARPDEFVLTLSRIAAVVAGVLVLVGGAGWRSDLSQEHLEVQLAKEYPLKAVPVIAEYAYAGPLYNHHDWGGFLMWHIPDMLVAADGRANLHGDARLKSASNTWWGLPGWDTDPELAGAGVVVADVKYPLASLLRLDQRFRLVYEDETAAVFVAAKALTRDQPHKSLRYREKSG